MKANRHYWKWPAATCDAFLALTWDSLALKASLANYYQTVRKPPLAVFNITIKSHYSAHVALFARSSINPTKVWAYSGEAFMKKLKAMVANNADGTPLHKLEPKAVDQYIVGMQFVLKQFSKECA